MGLIGLNKSVVKKPRRDIFKIVNAQDGITLGD